VSERAAARAEKGFGWYPAAHKIQPLKAGEVIFSLALLEAAAVQAGGGRTPPQPPSAHSCICSWARISHTWKSDFVGTGETQPRREARGEIARLRRSFAARLVHFLFMNEKEVIN